MERGTFGGCFSHGSWKPFCGVTWVVVWTRLTLGKASASLWHLTVRQVKVDEVKPPLYLEEQKWSCVPDFYIQWWKQQPLELFPLSFGGEHSISGNFSEGMNQRAGPAPLPQTERSPIPWEVPLWGVPVFREWACGAGAASPAHCALAFALHTPAFVFLQSCPCRVGPAWQLPENEPFPSDLQSWTCWPMCLLIIDIMLHYLGLFQQTDTLLPDRHLPDRLIDNILKKVSSCICTIKECNFITFPPTPSFCWHFSAMLPWNLNRNLSIITISSDNGLNLDFVGVVVLMLVSPQKYRGSLLNQSAEAIFLKIREIVLFFKPLVWKGELISPWLLWAVLEQSRDTGIAWCVSPRETCLWFFSNPAAVILSMDPRKQRIQMNYL